MRALVQRVTAATVRVAGEVVGHIKEGLVIFVGVGAEDTAAEASALAVKIAQLRIFGDAGGKFQHALLDVGGSALVISQFTLYANTRKGRRPSFIDAAAPEAARGLVDGFAAALRALGVPVECGEFGAHMVVELHNDGPVTIWLDTAAP